MLNCCCYFVVFVVVAAKLFTQTQAICFQQLTFVKLFGFVYFVGVAQLNVAAAKATTTNTGTIVQETKLVSIWKCAVDYLQQHTVQTHPQTQTHATCSLTFLFQFNSTNRTEQKKTCSNYLWTTFSKLAIFLCRLLLFLCFLFSPALFVTCLPCIAIRRLLLFFRPSLLNLPIK